jgi:hypothetical protein
MTTPRSAPAFLGYRDGVRTRRITGLGYSDVRIRAFQRVSWLQIATESRGRVEITLDRERTTWKAF